MIVAQHCEQFRRSKDKIHIVDENTRAKSGFDFIRCYCGLEPCGWFFSDYEFTKQRKLHPNSPKREKFCKICLRKFEVDSNGMG